MTKDDRAVLWLMWAFCDPEDTEWREHLNEEQAALVRLFDLTWGPRKGRKETVPT